MALLSSSRTTEQQHELREAKRLLKDRVRNDWEYPPLPAYQRAVKPRVSSDGAETAAGGFRFHSGTGDAGAIAGVTAGVGTDEITGYREREYNSSSPSGSGSEDDGGLAMKPSPRTTAAKGKKAGAFKFEGPDSVGVQIRGRGLARRRRRQRGEEEEMGWNEGLRHWVRRRDLWSGAVASSSDTTGEGQAAVRGGVAGFAEHGRPDGRPLPSDPTAVLESTESTPRTSTSSLGTLDLGAGVNSSAATTPDLTAPLHHQQQHSTSPNTQPQPPPSNSHPPTLLIPICAPILPTHPIRRRVSSSLNTEIYTKIILQSRTPSVPLNLQMLISALVEGWKADGEWPPKASVPEASLVAAKKGSVRRGVKGLVRSLRLSGTGSGTGAG
ncbi:hypothetical protein LTR62_004470 [Meristemomyces frigidus]|uniref:Gag1-like clamp domain-containing protein n=1 Tax=Meristemomyces frigidus TaxID=1508187 RepID=A0AAN7TDW6_9PEZI|nr:hypothetical protein LTR62_004470 [Meristemomyces frigidus]